MKYKLRVNNGVPFIPKQDFISEWAVWLYLKDLFGDEEIKNYRIDPILPELLDEQA